MTGVAALAVIYVFAKVLLVDAYGSAVCGAVAALLACLAAGLDPTENGTDMCLTACVFVIFCMHNGDKQAFLRKWICR